MDFERLERAWRSGANTPSEAAQTYVVESLMNTLKKRRDDTRGLLIISGGLLVLWTGLILHTILVRQIADIGREWSVLVVAALAWLGFAFVAGQLRRHLVAHPNPYASTHQTLQALLDENLGGQRRVFVMLGLQLVLAVALAIFFRQMLGVGKMEPAHVKQMAVMFAAIFAGIDGWLIWRLTRQLRPEAAQLRRLLDEYRGA